MTEGAASARTVRLVLEYDGHAFEGWQAQTGPRPARTVQGVLAAALEAVGGRSVRVRGAGRTDAGVHAEGQVASASFFGGPPVANLARALNAHLPEDVAVARVDAVPDDWDALREARGKHYRYQIWNAPLRSPLRDGRWAWVAEHLDRAAMAAAASRLVGRHDFASFQAAGSVVKTTVRRLDAVDLSEGAPGELRLDVKGEGFLRHMVRNIAGTLIEVGRGRWGADAVEAILAARDRARAGPTAPAKGLTLIAVVDSVSDPASRGAALDPSGEAAVGSVDAEGPVG